MIPTWTLDQVNLYGAYRTSCLVVMWQQAIVAGMGLLLLIKIYLVVVDCAFKKEFEIQAERLISFLKPTLSNELGPALNVR